MKKILVRVLDFTEYPGVRYKEQGDNDTGEDFYFKIINPSFQKALEENKMLEIDLDGTAGYASSFLDESFGNLVYDFPYNEILSRLVIKSNEEPDWIDIIIKESLVDWKRKKDDNQPRKPK